MGMAFGGNAIRGGSSVHQVGLVTTEEESVELDDGKTHLNVDQVCNV